MPNIRSAKKRVRQTKVRTLRNQSVKSSVRTSIRRFNEALENNGPESAQEQLNRAYSQLDKASKKGVIHKNAVARNKSRLAKKMNRVAEAAKVSE